MLRTILLVGLVAGSAAGVSTAVLQHVVTVPLIVTAETYESGTAQELHDHSSNHDARTNDVAESGVPALERTATTVGVTVLSAIGLSLVLVSVMLLGGERITPLTALAWAVGGFTATGLATGIGLPPELPGSAAADVTARQLWWAGTAVATVGGLYALFKLRTPIAIAAGIALLVSPHLVGAPHPPVYTSTVPPELAARFASASLAVHAAFWALVGLCAGAAWRRLSPD